MFMKMKQKFAMGHTFSAQDIFFNFPIKKLQMDYDTVKKVYSDGDKRALSASIFMKGMQLIVEDIIETGNTLYHLQQKFLKENCKSCKIAALLVKNDILKDRIKVDYTGFAIENDFVVGYGMDYNNKGRNLKSIYTIVKA